MIASLFLSACVSASASDSAAPLRLDEALALARTANPDRARSRAALEAADARADQGRGALLPTLSATTDYSRLGPHLGGGARSSAAARMDGDAQWKTTLDAKWTVFDGFRSWQGVAALSSRRDAAVATDSAVATDLDLAVATGWANLWLAERRVESSRSSLDVSLVRRNIAKERHAIGALAGLEAGQASVDAARDSLAWIRSRAARENAARQLNLLLGRASTTPIAVSPAIDSGASDPLGGAAPAGTVDLRAVRLLEEASARDVSGAKGTFWPEIALYADYTHLGTLHDETPPPDAWNQGMVYGARATWQLFEGGRNFGRVREASASYAQAKSARLALERSRDADLEAARSRWETAQDALALERSADAQTESVLQAALARFRSGDLPGSDLRRYQDSRLQASVQYAEARAERLLAGLALRHAAGLPVRP